MEKSSSPGGVVSKLPDELRHGTKAYDLIAAVPMVVFFGFGAAARLGQLHHQLGQIDFRHPHFPVALEIICNSGGLVLAAMFIVLLFARRPPIAGIKQVKARCAAIAASFLSLGILFFPKSQMGTAVLVLSTLLITGGIGFSIYSLSWLGRSYSVFPEARRLVTGGPYKIVRHPLYFGEEVAIIGVTIQFFSPVAVIICALQIMTQIYRIRFEEEILEESFPEYGSYKSSVARLVPGIY